MHQKLCDLSLAIFNSFFCELLEKSRQISNLSAQKVDLLTFISLQKVTASKHLRNKALLVANRLLKATKQEYLNFTGNELISKSNISQYLLAIYLCIWLWPGFESELANSIYIPELLEIVNVTLSEVYLRHPKSELGFIAITLLQKMSTCRELSLAFNFKMKNSVNLKLVPLIVGNYCDLILSNLLKILEDSISNDCSFYIKNIIATIRNIGVFPRCLCSGVATMFTDLLNLAKCPEQLCKRIENLVIFCEIIEAVEQIFVISFGTASGFIYECIRKMDVILSIEGLHTRKSHLFMNNDDFRELRKADSIKLTRNIK
jgi:hypothetical protein